MITGGQYLLNNNVISNNCLSIKQYYAEVLSEIKHLTYIKVTYMNIHSFV